MDRITILFVHASSDLYGSDKVLLDLLLNLDQNRFKPIVILPGKGPLFDSIQHAGIEVHDLTLARIARSGFSPAGIVTLVVNIIVSLIAISKVVAGRKIDIIHSNTLAVVSGALWALCSNAKHLWHVHEIIEHPDIINTYYPRLVNLLSCKVVANSAATREWLVSRSPGLRSKTITILNGLCHKEMVAIPEISRIRSFCTTSDGEVVVALVGRINRLKGHKILVDALEILAAKGIRGIRALIVGSPPPGQEHFKTDLCTYIHESSVAGMITLMDFTADIWPVWAACDIAVVPSTEPESFGMVAIEAMSAHKPVIASNHGGLVEIVEDGITGLLVPPQDAGALAVALESLVSDPVRRKEMGERGFQRQKEFFSLEAYTTAFESQYIEIASSQRNKNEHLTGGIA
jgi:glycosyltransferase involved in cell wall biosynthesis